MRVEITKSHFLNPEHKKIKQEIMEGIFELIQSKMIQHVTTLDKHSSTDIIFSCAVMFAREILVDMIVSSGHPLEMMSSVVMQFNAIICTSVQESIENLLRTDGVPH